MYGWLEDGVCLKCFGREFGDEELLMKWKNLRWT
jgi:hypothetical protein